MKHNQKSNHTFHILPPAPWNTGSSTAFATSSKLFSFAFPIRVMGVSLLTNLVRFKDLLLKVSSQILCTKDTGSTGSRVLKKRTVYGNWLYPFCIRKDLDRLTTLDINLDRHKKSVVLRGRVLNPPDFLVDFGLDVVAHPLSAFCSRSMTRGSVAVDQSCIL